MRVGAQVRKAPHPRGNCQKTPNRSKISPLTIPNYLQNKGPNRLIPLWPELQPYLERLFEEAPEGSLRIIQRYQPGQNMHTALKKIVERAGLKTWPRLIHNLRGSRQEEIGEEFGIVCATEWIGNTEAVAKDHYLRVREADFERALNSGEQAGCREGVQCFPKQKL